MKKRDKKPANLQDADRCIGEFSTPPSATRRCNIELEDLLQRERAHKDIHCKP